jgi:hypothetical protein
MRTGLKATAAIIGGCVAGVASAYAVMGSLDAGEGPWRDRQAGVVSGNPYALARQLLTGRLPAPAPAAEFEYARDEDGAALDPDCTYLIEGKVPAALWWSLAAGSGGGGRRPSSIASGEAVAEQDGTVRIRVSPEPQPGNWIAPPSAGPFVIRLALFRQGRETGETRPPDLGVSSEVCR